MIKYRIEKNIPVPCREVRGGIKKNIFPFAKMEVGDSFCFEYREIIVARSCASYYGKSHKMKFISRGDRVWRVK